MSVRYTATWYGVMQARQHHTHQSSTVSYSQCCQVAEIPAKKLKRGRRKKNLWPNFGGFYQKLAEKGPQKIFKKVPYF